MRSRTINVRLVDPNLILLLRGVKFWISLQKTKYHPTTDILRIHAKSPNYRYVDESTKILVLQKFHLSCQRSNYQTDQIYCRYEMDTLCLPQAV